MKILRATVTLFKSQWALLSADPAGGQLTLKQAQK